MGYKRIYESVVNVIKRRIQQNKDVSFSYLDVGAGRGELIGLIQSVLPVEPQACDYHTERFRKEGIPIKKVDFNVQPLPYDDESFDLVTCSEVLEHLENFRSIIREVHRVLRPDGICIFTTPNVLNMKSRIRYLGCGFFNLFNPLTIKNTTRYLTGGHITPIPFFYLAHAFADADFADIQLDIDKVQRSSVFWLIILSPFLVMEYAWFIWNQYITHKTITDENKKFVSLHFSLAVLTGRTAVVSAKKCSNPHLCASMS